MDGVHDLGGKAGFGAVDVAEPEEPFHAPYEGRMWAISRLTRGPGFTIDWWRHVRELIPQDDYLNRPYFDSWAQTTMATMIDSGVFTRTELIASQADQSAPMHPPQTTLEIRKNNAKMGYRFDRGVQHSPRFDVGTSVTTAPKGHSGHTRLPEYARGKTGVVYALRGAHIFPDAAACGDERADHLYTVSFSATELWGQSEGTQDYVLLDLWEGYLEPA